MNGGPASLVTPLVFVILSVLVAPLDGKIGENIVCTDPACSEMVGVARTTVTHSALEPGMLNFKANQEVKIYGRGVDDNDNLVAVMINGKKGFVHKKHIQEMRVYHKSPSNTVNAFQWAKLPREGQGQAGPTGNQSDSPTPSQQVVDASSATRPSSSPPENSAPPQPPDEKPPIVPADENLNSSGTTGSGAKPTEQRNGESEQRQDTPPVDLDKVEGDRAPTPADTQPVLEPSRTQPPHEVFDGTTFYLDGGPEVEITTVPPPHLSSINPSFIQPTAMSENKHTSDGPDLTGGSTMEPEIESSVLSPELQVAQALTTQAAGERQEPGDVNAGAPASASQPVSTAHNQPPPTRTSPSDGGGAPPAGSPSVPSTSHQMPDPVRETPQTMVPTASAAVDGGDPDEMSRQQAVGSDTPSESVVRLEAFKATPSSNIMDVEAVVTDQLAVEATGINNAETAPQIPEGDANLDVDVKLDNVEVGTNDGENVVDANEPAEESGGTQLPASEEPELAMEGDAADSEDISDEGEKEESDDGENEDDDAEGDLDEEDGADPEDADEDVTADYEDLQYEDAITKEADSLADNPDIAEPKDDKAAPIEGEDVVENFVGDGQGVVEKEVVASVDDSVLTIPEIHDEPKPQVNIEDTPEHGESLDATEEANIETDHEETTLAPTESGQVVTEQAQVLEEEISPEHGEAVDHVQATEATDDGAAAGGFFSGNWFGGDSDPAATAADQEIRFHEPGESQGNEAAADLESALPTGDAKIGQDVDIPDPSKDLSVDQNSIDQEVAQDDSSTLTLNDSNLDSSYNSEHQQAHQWGQAPESVNDVGQQHYDSSEYPPADNNGQFQNQYSSESSQLPQYPEDSSGQFPGFPGEGQYVDGQQANNYEYQFHSPYDEAVESATQDPLSSGAYDYGSMDPSYEVPTPSPLPDVDSMLNYGSPAESSDPSNDQYQYAGSNSYAEESGAAVQDQGDAGAYVEPEVPVPDAGDDATQKEDVVESFMDMLPEWLHLSLHGGAGGPGPALTQERMFLLGVVALTLLLMHLINLCMARSGREKPLIAKLAELDRKLFQSTNELLVLRKELAEKSGAAAETDSVPSQQLRELEIELEQAKVVADQIKGQYKQIEDRYTELEQSYAQLLASKQVVDADLETVRAESYQFQEEARQAQEMIEEMIQSQNNNTNDDKLAEMVGQLQKQLENQKEVLKQYEPKLKKKEKEAKELSKELKQLKVDVANAQLARDKLSRELEDVKVKEEANKEQTEQLKKSEDEWHKLADLLQSQLDEKETQIGNMEEELTSVKSRMTLFKNELDSKEEQCEVLQEALDEIQNRKKNGHSSRSSVERSVAESNDHGDGWEIEDDLEVDLGDKAEDDSEQDNLDIQEIREVAKLRISAKKAANRTSELEQELEQLKTNMAEINEKLSTSEQEVETLRLARDETVKDAEDTRRKLEVLTQFFNKKETELQKQLGLQSARFGDVTNNADSMAKQLISVTSELESTQGALKVLRSELEDQEKSLKAAVALQEKKAHENWVAARQAERKLNDCQMEVSTLRNRLTAVEAQKHSLEQEKADLQQTLASIPQLGSNKDSVNGGLGDASGPSSIADTVNNNSNDTSSLPPLPGMAAAAHAPAAMLPPFGVAAATQAAAAAPLMMPPPTAFFGAGAAASHLPPFMDSRPPPLGRMSPNPRDRSDLSFRSSSPPLHHRRDYSPSSRSERRIGGRRGASPTRSERGYYYNTSRVDSSPRSYRRGGDNYDQPSSREDHYERRGRDFSDEDYERPPPRGRHERPRQGRDYLTSSLASAPKTSSPMDPDQRNY